MPHGETNILECPKCKRKIVLIRAINGSNHDISTDVSCWDCLNAKDKTNVKDWVKNGGPPIRIVPTCITCGQTFEVMPELADHNCPNDKR